ncbi:MAG: 4'-phosphopantetheinyl transferase superfamily protein [Rhodanobacteraceae bacterium]
MKTISASAFKLCDAPPSLAAGEIHLWYLCAPDADQHRNAAAKAANRMLEQLLAIYAGRDSLPAISRGPHGKPCAETSVDIEFNVSHSGRCALLAFARGQPLGVDLECLDRRQRFEDIAERYFAPDEARDLARLPSDRHPAAFLGLWTCKEAVVKALGVGLGFGLDRLRFRLDADGRPESLESIAADGGSVADWRILSLAPAPALLGALAWHGPPRHVRVLRWPA